MASSLVCALLVALLWGANISVLLPLVEVVANNQRLGQRVDEAIKVSEGTIANKQAAEAQLESQLEQAPADQELGLRREIATPYSKGIGAQHGTRRTTHGGRVCIIVR